MNICKINPTNFKNIKALPSYMAQKRGELKLLPKNATLVQMSKDLVSTKDLRYVNLFKKKLNDFSKKTNEESIIAVLCSPMSCDGHVLMKRKDFKNISKKKNKLGYPIINRTLYYDKSWFEWKTQELTKF